MKKINFKQFGIYEDIAKRSQRTIDISEVFANIIYRQTTGVRAHELAMRIYREGEIQIGSEDEQLIVSVAHRFCTPAFIDAINEQLKD
jgi:accessory colonization factor AcfC